MGRQRRFREDFTVKKIFEMNPEGYEKIIQKVIGKNKNAISASFLVEVFNFIFTFNFFFVQAIRFPL